MSPREKTKREKTKRRAEKPVWAGPPDGLGRQWIFHVGTDRRAGHATAEMAYEVAQTTAVSWIHLNYPSYSVFFENTSPTSASGKFRCPLVEAGALPGLS